MSQQHRRNITTLPRRFVSTSTVSTMKSPVILSLGDNATAKDSMLASLVPDRWCKSSGNDEDEDNATLFIDRNGAHFGYLLDYLRYGSVQLLVTVSKADFLRDLDYYGISVADDGDIRNTAHPITEWEATISKIVQREVGRPSKQGPSDFVATACATNWIKTSEFGTRFHHEHGFAGQRGWSMMEIMFTSYFDKQMFNESLKPWNLRCVKSERTWGSVYIHVARLPAEDIRSMLPPMGFKADFSSEEFS